MQAPNKTSRVRNRSNQFKLDTQMRGVNTSIPEADLRLLNIQDGALCDNS